MRRIKEVLRLKEGLGLSDTAVSRSVRIARSTVKEYLDRAAAAGLKWETVAELSEEELDRRLFAAVDTRHWDRPLPDWEAVEKELRGAVAQLNKVNNCLCPALRFAILRRHVGGRRGRLGQMAGNRDSSCHDGTRIFRGSLGIRLPNTRDQRFSARQCLCGCGGLE